MRFDNLNFTLLNGSEPKYDLKKWNENLKIKRTHNCYAYVLDIVKSFKRKPQPGFASGYSYLTDSDIRSCDKMFERIRADNPSLIKVNYDDKCPNHGFGLKECPDSRGLRLFCSLQRFA